eukprot:gene19348-3738_t
MVHGGGIFPERSLERSPEGPMPPISEPHSLPTALPGFNAVLAHLHGDAAGDPPTMWCTSYGLRSNRCGAALPEFNAVLAHLHGEAAGGPPTMVCSGSGSGGGGDDGSNYSTEGLKEWRTDFLSQTFQATELECDIAPYRSYVQYSNYSESFFNAITDEGGSATFRHVQSETGGYSYLEADSADRCNAALHGINVLLAHLSNSTGGGDDDGGGGPVATPMMNCSSSR